jgi:hypothetical protein
VECTHSYELYLYKCNLYLAGDVNMAIGLETSVLEPNWAYAQVFSEADLDTLPSHGSQDLAIVFLNGKQLPQGPIYNTSKKKLETLKSYFKIQLKRSSIRLLKSLTRASSLLHA